MAANFKLTPDPTFKAKVGIPVPGGDAVPVEFTFKYRGRDEVKSWMEQWGERSVEDVLPDLLAGWELQDEFTAANIARLCDHYPRAAALILDAYLRELSGARLGN